MTDKDLRKLSREDLLQLLLEQGRKVRQLREKLAAAEKALDDRMLKMDKAGSIAEASLQLNGVFEAAEAACRQYTDNAVKYKESWEEKMRKMSEINE